MSHNILHSSPNFKNIASPLDICNGANGVFETMRAYEGKIFKLFVHIERLFASAKSINLKISYTPLELEELVKTGLKKRKIKEAYVRLALVPQANAPSKVNLIIKEANIYPPIFYQKGIKLVTAPTRRNLIVAQNSKIKSSNFLNAILAKIETSGLNTFEVILLNKDNLVTEGTTSNIFIIKNETVFTPPAYLGLLEGVTRAVVIDLALDRKYKVKQAPFNRIDIYNADEVFLTNSSIEIMPVVWVDGRLIAGGKVGRITKELTWAYKSAVRRELEVPAPRKM